MTTVTESANNLGDIAKYVDQRVVLKYRTGETVSEVTGTLLAASAVGIMFKPRGRTQGEIVETDRLVDIDHAPVKPKNLKAKKLKEITFGQARQHLADRHGTPLSALKDLDEQQALTLHEGIDHADLGHKHTSDTDAPEAAAGSIGADNPDGADPQDEDDEDSDEYTDDEDERD